MGWTGQHLRHVAELARQGRNPAARVYESIGSGFFLAPAPGWPNLGLWDGPGSPVEAEDACRRLVRTLASALPAGGVVVDVGNGLGAQDPLIAQAVRPGRLVALNITEWQLTAGLARLREAAAAPVAANATRLPFAAGPVDGIISVEAAFHFRSRGAFFEECYRVLRPGGVLSISDISIQRWPVTPGEPPPPATTLPPGCCYGRSTCSGGVASSTTCSCARSARAMRGKQLTRTGSDREIPWELPGLLFTWCSIPAQRELLNWTARKRRDLAHHPFRVINRSRPAAYKGGMAC
jgi:SAM-dependent methyltransferase